MGYLLDLFCGAGGCSEGYTRGGFRVVGIDIEPIKHYIHPGSFYRVDAMRILESLSMYGEVYLGKGFTLDLDDIEAIHASPPCQGYSATKRFNPHIEYPMLIEDVRKYLMKLNKPYIIENVEGAPLYARVILCGAMFPEAGLRTYRHRQFETNFHVAQPIHMPHLVPNAKMGRPPKDGEFMHVVGNFPSAQYARDAMGIQWMNREELAEAIPPAYTEYISSYLAAAVLSNSWV